MCVFLCFVDPQQSFAGPLTKLALGGVRVLSSFIKPILGNRYGPGVIP